MYERTDPEDQKGGDSKYNENEATLVGKHVEAMIKAGLPASSISIISPYQAQVALLTRLLKPRYPKLEIGSIDGFQASAILSFSPCIPEVNKQYRAERMIWS